MATSDTLIRFPAVRARTSLGRSRLYELLALGRFPKPTKLGTRAVAWSESEVNAWVSDRLSEREAN